MSELQVRKVVAAYDGAPVLHGVSFTVPSGAFAAVLGPSGSGKSTLLRTIAGLHAPLEGAIVVGGRVLTGPRVAVPPERRRIGIVPQDAALFPHLDVRANVAFGLPRAQRGGARPDELLEMVGLADLAHRMPGELSGGQRHRVALARALAPEPDVILLDEPFSALDASLRAEVRAQIRQVLRRARTTAVLVTHDQDEALSMADIVAVLDQGRLVQVGPPEEIYQEPRSRWLAQFVGGAVVLPGAWRGDAVTCALGDVPARLGAGEVAREGDAVELAIRPEHLTLAPVGEGLGGVAGGATGAGTDAGTNAGTVALVRHVAYFGHDAVVTLDLPGLDQPIEARVLGVHHIRPDAEVRVSVTRPGIAFAAR